MFVSSVYCLTLINWCERKGTAVIRHSRKGTAVNSAWLLSQTRRFLATLNLNPARFPYCMIANSRVPPFPLTPIPYRSLLKNMLVNEGVKIFRPPQIVFRHVLVVLVWLSVGLLSASDWLERLVTEIMHVFDGDVKPHSEYSILYSLWLYKPYSLTHSLTHSLIPRSKSDLTVTRTKPHTK